MNATEKYVHDVLRNVPAPARERQRIESDLRAHLAEAAAAGQPAEAVLARMGKPEEVAAEFMATVPLAYAGFGPRALAFVVDMAAIIAVAGALAGLGVLFGNLVPRNPAGFDYVVGAVLIALAAANAIGAVGVLFIYFPLLEGRFGQTLGKRLLGLRVLRENGLPIGYKEALLRRLSFYFDIFPFDAAFVFFTEKRQRAFDIVARTVVISER
jgi:uncharacterized RDD family membrane protein YckC